MNKNLIINACLSLFASAIIVSCGSSKTVTNKTPAKNTTTKTIPAKSEHLRSLNSNFSGKTDKLVKNLLKDAEKYIGVPYKYGGNTSSGFDCSGFTVKVFAENELKLPRRSVDQSSVGDNIEIQKVQPGDLLFFATAGGTRVSHVGIVHNIENDGEVKFIHASTSKGVIISSLSEKYWNKAYLHAQRVL